MTPWIGHEAAEAAFSRALDSGSLHHAWLLTGPEGVGKASFAKAAGRKLLGAGTQHDPLIAARSHPDLKVVEREVWDGKSPPNIVPYDERKPDDAPARSIRIAQIRMLLPVLAKAPSLGSRRAIIIDSADDMERPAANALLKSLEEPPTGTVFLLVSHAPGRLLPTIRSRCRVLRFPALSDNEMRRALGHALPDTDGAEIDALVTAGEGSPGRALRFAGLDVAGLDQAMATIATTGDPQVSERAALARALSARSAQPRYEAFLERVPAFLAAQARTLSGPALAKALDAHTAARDVAAAARGLSLDAQGTVWELAGLIAGLAGPTAVAPLRRRAG